MSRLARLATTFVLVRSLAACGGAPAAVSKPATAAAAAAAPSSAAAAGTGGAVRPGAAEVRVPSSTLARRWPFTARVTTAAFVDVAGMSRTVAGDERVLLPILGLVVDAKRKDALLRCARDALGRTREIVVGASHETSLVELAAVPGGAQAIASSCFDGASSFAKAAALPGADDGWTGTDFDGSPLLVARVGDVLLLGTPGMVMAAVAPPASPHPLPKALTLAADQYAVVDTEVEGTAAVHFVLSDSARRLAVETEITVGDANAAALLSAKLGALTAWPPNAFEGSPTPEVTGALHRLSKALTITSRDASVDARFELVEPPEMQAYDVAIYANLTASLVHYTLRQGELAEPRATLPGIARRYAEATDDAAKKNHVGRRLESYPPVPSRIPSGKAVTTTSAEWTAWRALSVELREPQSFQYEIVADRRGKAADVVARGDLDGDGVVSTLRVHVSIDPTSHEVVTGDVTEDPEPLPPLEARPATGGRPRSR